MQLNMALSSSRLIAQANPDPVIWVRHNPNRLTKEELAWVRSTLHLREDEVQLEESVYLSLIRHGHRYIGELEFMTREEVLDMVPESHLKAMNKELRRHGIVPGGRRKGGEKARAA